MPRRPHDACKALRALLVDLGLKHPEAAQMLHVSLRTLQNWLSGRHEVPYVVVKLLRLLRSTWSCRVWAGEYSDGSFLADKESLTSKEIAVYLTLLIKRCKLNATCTD